MQAESIITKTANRICELRPSYRYLCCDHHIVEAFTHDQTQEKSQENERPLAVGSLRA